MAAGIPHIQYTSNFLDFVSNVLKSSFFIYCDITWKILQIANILPQTVT